MALTSQHSSLRSSTSSSHFIYFEILILILPFPFDFILHLYLNLIGSFINKILYSFNKFSKRIQIIYSITYYRFLNFLVYLIQLKFLFGEPFPISSTTKPFDSYTNLLSSSSSSNPTHHQPRLSSYSNSRASILITNNSDHHPLALNLALEFAKVGYHVFLQVSSQSQLSEVILRWQRLKSQINKSLQSQSQPSSHQLFSIQQQHHQHQTQSKTTITGSLIPLVYTTHHLDQRNDAISTIRAYAREESFDMISLIHVIHPQFIRQSHLNPPITPTPSISPNISPSRSTRRLSVTSHDPIGLTSPTHHVLNLNHHSSSSSPTTSFYPNYQIPISSCSESYLFDTFNDLLLGPLSHTQDFLPTLISLRGRVLHIWASDQNENENDSLNLMGLGRDGVKRMVKMLGSELKPFRIPVSLIFTKTKTSKKIRVPNHQLTNDVRSILTEDSDPLILKTFQNQVQVKDEEERKFKEKEDEDEEGVEEDQEVLLRYVKSALESQFPHELYPLSVNSLLNEIGKTFKAPWMKK